METHPRPTRRRPRRLDGHEPRRSSRHSGRASRQAETGTTQAQPLPQQLRLAPGPGPAPRITVSHLATAGSHAGPACANLDKVLVTAAKTFPKNPGSNNNPVFSLGAPLPLQ